MPAQQDPKPGSTPPQEPQSCDGQFFSERRTEADWYPKHDFPDKGGCSLKPHKVNRKKSLTIYWAPVAKDWTKATAKEKVDAAKKWFERYCVTLDDKYVDLMTNRKRYDEIVQRLAAANTAGRDPYARTINEVYLAAWRAAGAPKDPFLLVLFVDPYRAVEFTANRWSAVSANYADIPLILITAADKGKEHIFTHEVLHGLGKELNPSKPTSAVTHVVAPAGSKPYYGGVGDSKSTWDEAPCEKDMGNPKDLSSAKDDAPIDWAAYWEYVKVAKTLK